MLPVAIECVRNIRQEALASFWEACWEACHVAKQNVTNRALEAWVDEALAGNQELQSYVQRLDSGLVDEDQEPPDELNYLTEDDLPSEIPSLDVTLRELEEFLHQNQQDPGPNSGSDDPSDSV
jgi:hypothetical protein